MKKYNNFIGPLIVGAILGSTALPSSVYSAGAVTAYDVTVNKMELCKDATCSASITIGASAKEFDIASAGVGSAIGSYASLDMIPKGTSISHVRVTLSRTLGIAGTLPDPGNVGGTCGTNGADNTSAVNAAGIGTVGGGGTMQMLVVPNEGSIFGQPAIGTYAAFGMTILSPIEMQFLKALPSPVVMGDVPPVIDIAFETATGLLAFDSNGGAPGGDCLMLPGAPVVHITRK